MTDFLKRTVCLLLATVMLVGITSCGGKEDGGKENSKENGDLPYSSFDREATPDEEEYIQAHLEYIEDTEYKDAMLYSGGLPTVISNNYKDAKLNYVNGLWKGLSSVVKIAGKGELELVNEYEVLVAELMQSTGSEDVFARSFEGEYLNSVIDLIGNINTVLKDAKSATGIFTGSDIDKVEELTKKIDVFMAYGTGKKGKFNKDYEPMFEDIMKDIKEAFESDFIKNNETFIKNTKTLFGSMGKITSYTSDSLTDMMEQVAFYQAAAGASEEWDKVWSSISDAARDSGDKEGEKIAKCIDKLLGEVRSYREDSTLAAYKSAAGSFGKNAIELAYSEGQGLLSKTLDKHILLKAIKEGAVTGVSISNALFNCDDIAHYGQMLIGYGSVSEYAHSALKSAEGALTSKATYENALLFDQAFHIYKAIQLSAADCAINYCTAIASAPMGYVFKYTTSDEIASSVLMLAHKADWQGYNCHDNMKVINNGGEVVGYMGNVYYIRYGAGYYSDGATLRNYDRNYDVENELVCRSADGSEKVIIKTNCSAPIFICNDKLIFRQGYDKWVTMPVSGEGSHTAMSGRVVLDLMTARATSDYMDGKALLCSNSDGKNYHLSDFAGNTMSVAADYIADDILYEIDDGLFKCFTVDLENKTKQEIGQVQLYRNEYSMYPSVETVVSDGEEVFVLLGYRGGSGNFFSDGSIYVFKRDGSSSRKLETDLVQLPAIRLEVRDGEKYIYYHTDVDWSGTIDGGAYSKGGSCINVATGEITESSEIIAHNDMAYFHNGSVGIIDGLGDAKTLVSSQTLASLGYSGSSDSSDSFETVFVRSAEVVRDTVYVTLELAVRNTDYDFGWREGYSWTKMEHYAIDIESQEATLLFEYKK